MNRIKRPREIRSEGLHAIDSNNHALSIIWYRTCKIIFYVQEMNNSICKSWNDYIRFETRDNDTVIIVNYR